MSLDRRVTRDLATRLISEELRQLERFEQLLEREAQALRSDDVEAIGTAGAERQACSSELLRIDEERREACRMLGFGDGRDAFRRLLDACDLGGELAQRWHSSLSLVQRCREANDRNGAMVTAKLRRVESLLAAMRGDEPSARTYGAGGRHPAPARSVPLGLA